MSAGKRPRSVANPAIGIDRYKEVFASWLRGIPGHLVQVIGPSLASDTRGVTPAALVALTDLLNRLFDAGLSNGMVLPSKFEAGIKQALADQPEKAGKSAGLDLWPHEIAEHVKHAFGMLRMIKLEQVKPPKFGVSKTAAFKRKATTAETILINLLVAKVVLDDTLTSSSHSVSATTSSLQTLTSCETLTTSCATALCDAQSQSAKQSIFDEEAFSSNIPSCFSNYLNNVGAQALATTPLSSPRSTVWYDEDGFPAGLTDAELVCTPIRASAMPPPALVSPAPVQSAVRTRKKAAMQTRENNKSKGGYAKVDAAKPAKAAKDLDTIIHNPRKSLGKGENPRMELCAQDADNKRVFIYSSTLKAYGARLDSDAMAVCKYIEQTPNVTKVMALAYKAKLQSESP